MPIIETLKLALIGICLWSIWQGGGPERLGAVLLLLAFFAKELLKVFGIPIDFFGPNLVHSLIVTAFFFASLILAVQSNRVWPLFFSAFWLVEVTGHLSIFVIEFGMSRAYWGMTQGPIVVQAVVLGLGTVACSLRNRRGVHARDWRKSHQLQGQMN